MIIITITGVFTGNVRFISKYLLGTIKSTYVFLDNMFVKFLHVCSIAARYDIDMIDDID